MNLKNRFAGYKVEVVVKSEHVLNMMGIIEKKLPGQRMGITSSQWLI